MQAASANGGLQDVNRDRLDEVLFEAGRAGSFTI